VTIVIYYEHAQREYLSVSLLAEILKQKGYRVHVYTAFLEKYRGIRRLRKELKARSPAILVVPWLYNDVNRERWLEAAAGARCAVLNLHWEQIVSPNVEHFTLGTPLDEFIYHVCWGQGLATRLGQAGVPSERTYVTGHPNFDFYCPPLCRILTTRSELARAHGLCPENEWVLVPLNFVHAWRSPTAEVFGEQAESLATWTQASQRMFVEGVACLARQFPRLEFILRPHPGEDPRRYRKSLGDDRLPNIHVVQDGQLAEWTVACDRVVFWSSTSSVEAYYSQRPFICYLPVPPPDNWAPPHVALAPTATNMEELTAFLRSDDPQSVGSEYAEFVEQFYGPKDGHSVARIAAVVDMIAAAGNYTDTRVVPYRQLVVGSCKEHVRLACARLFCGRQLPEWPKRFARVSWWWDALRTDYVPPRRRKELAEQMTVLAREYVETCREGSGPSSRVSKRTTP
jgi:surface carbohydrate biosynthesis protein